MSRMNRVVLLVGLVALTPVLSACADFDMDKLDVFGLNEKKKLPGERKDVFPQGVPGVSQGIPQEYIKGNQPPENAQVLPVEPEKSAAGKPDRKTAAIQSTDEPKPKPKRKPKPPQPAQPAQQEQQAPQQAQSPNQGMAPWPATPAPGTFSR
jgi:FtsZ-interacting cell division protein ZipA